jgi:mannosyltransferase OCH1-like enzyme
MFYRLIFCCCLVLLNCQLYAFSEPSFEQSITSGSEHIQKIWDQYKDTAFNKLVANTYLQRSPSKMPYNITPIIPKIMHQIWLGGDDLPPLYENYMEECKLLHPDWEFRLWRDNDIDSVLTPKSRHLYEISRTWLQKSDILRYAILLKHGGVYRDTDIKCYRSLNELNHKYSFYAVSEFILEQLDGYLPVNNGFIGTTPNHPIIADTLEIIDNSLPNHLDIYDSAGSEDYPTIAWFVIKTTMYPLRDAIEKNLMLDQTSIVLPVTYEFPCIRYSLYEIYNSNSLSNFIKFIVGNKIQEQYPFHCIKPESFIYHNIVKSEIGNLSFANGMDMFDPDRQDAFAMLPNEDKHMLKSIEQYYRQNNASKLPFKRQGEIPKKLIFVVLYDKEKSILDLNMASWVMLNRNFVLEIWDKDMIFQIMPDIKQYFTDKKHDIEELRFLVGLELINRFGGHYADFRIKPISPLFELGNKYKLYIGLQAVNNHNL